MTRSGPVLGTTRFSFFADHTTHADSVAAGNDVILGFNPNSTLWIYGYANATFGSSAAGVTLTLSDGTQLTFQGITDADDHQGCLTPSGDFA